MRSIEIGRIQGIYVLESRDSFRYAEFTTPQPDRANCQKRIRKYHASYAEPDLGIAVSDDPRGDCNSPTDSQNGSRLGKESE